MPEYLRALIVIMVLAAAVFAFAKNPACAAATSRADFARRRNLWFGITLAAFLANNFWIYAFATAAMLIFTARRETNRLAMYLFVLFAVPPISAEIEGMGVLQNLFSLDYLRLLSLAVLFPAYLSLRKQPDSEAFGRSLPDKLLTAYLILQFLLMLDGNTFTNTLRQGAFYAFLDIFLPYYVASRSLKTLPVFRDTLMAFVVAALVLSAVAVFEFARHWLLYASLGDALGVYWDSGKYLARGESLRALGSAGHPIALGYIMAVAAGFFVYFRSSVPSATTWVLGLTALLLGLIAPVSRGPWLGVTAMLIVFIATSPFPFRGFAKLGLLILIAVPLLMAFPAGREILDHLPFFGTVESENITYRQRLVEISMQVIMEHPFFGTFDYIDSPAMQELKQGQGIIDVVNTYMGIGLSSGLVGLSLFASFFLAVAVGIFRGMRNLADRSGELYLLGRILLATLLGIMVMIATVSNILAIPVIYWMVAGLGVAYARMLALSKMPAAVRPVGFIRWAEYCLQHPPEYRS